jgi:hypothetical protein
MNYIYDDKIENKPNMSQEEFIETINLSLKDILEISKKQENLLLLDQNEFYDKLIEILKTA